MYDKYLYDAAQKSSDDFEMAANIVARDSLKLATECAAVAFVQALDSMYPKYNAPAFFGKANGAGEFDFFTRRVRELLFGGAFWATPSAGALPAS